MRFKITLQVKANHSGRELPLNYQYESASAIYDILSRSDREYSGWLHENGFSADKKRFKLFSFSRLIVPKYGIDKENQRLIIQSDVVYWYITFLPEKSTRNFIEGVFKQQTFQIGDKYSAVEFTVREIQLMPPLEYKEEMYFETMSPVCISLREADGRTTYLSPADPAYTEGLLIGLSDRYKAFHGQEFAGSKYCDLQLLNEPKSVLVKIKANTPQQTFVRGYIFRFKIRLPEELMQIAYENGIGEKGSIGFGMIKEIER